MPRLWPPSCTHALPAWIYPQACLRRGPPCFGRARWLSQARKIPKAAKTAKTKTAETEKAAKIEVTVKTAVPAKTKTAKTAKTKTAKTVKTAKTKTAQNAQNAPTSPDRLPLALSLKQLSDLALFCGRNTTGTKVSLRADLTVILDGDDSNSPSLDKEPSRILSIDMGVRNLAFCLLQLPSGPASVPQLVAWERLSLVDSPESTSATGTTPPVDAFSPPNMAAVAARLVLNRLLPLAPSHVLIERQRFRSGGASTVLEWTVRVNSLEAMLHGILAYCRLDKVAAAAAAPAPRVVQAVSPQRVSQFLLRGGISVPPSVLAAVAQEKKRKKEKDIKDVKEAFVAHALSSRSSGRLFSLHPDSHLRDMVDAFLTRWDVKQKKTRKRSTSKDTLALTKIDDLADCITQGLVWLQWERNRDTLRQHGATALLDASLLP